MHQIKKNEFLEFFRHHWKWWVFALAILLGLLLAPQGVMKQHSAGEGGMLSGIGSIIPDGIFEPTEDGSSYGYNDRCGNNSECRSCKSNLNCLKCMDKCYNRHGPFHRIDNPRAKMAMSCNTRCVTEAKHTAEKSSAHRFVRNSR